MRLHSRSSTSIVVIVVMVGAVELAACSSSSSSGKSAETTAARVESARADALERLDQSAELVTSFAERIPEPVAERARCLVVVPSLVKGGVLIGGEGGKGYATCQVANAWSAPAPVSVAGGSFGAQLGVQSTELVALVSTEKGMNALASGNFRVGVDASASAGPVGTGRATSADVQSGSDLVSYARSKGLFAGATLNGSDINGDAEATRALYGSRYELNAILGGRVPPPNVPAVQRFLSAVEAGFGKRARAGRAE